MGNVSNINKIDLSLKNIWRSWFLFRHGKKKIIELEDFQYNLEENLWWLYDDLQKNCYSHGSYKYFIIQQNKRRHIAVAQVRDRVVHRLVYEYLVGIYDKIFIFDVWSCRKNKGLLGAIDRTQKFFKKYPNSFVWRADITKFFNNVNIGILFNIICRKIIDNNARSLIAIILKSFIGVDIESGIKCRGIPIGNLTSQIFANIYLNELDRLVKHKLKPQFYLRYGDDFIIITKTITEAEIWRKEIIRFLKNSLSLELNYNNDINTTSKAGHSFFRSRYLSHWSSVETTKLATCSSKIKQAKFV